MQRNGVDKLQTALTTAFRNGEPDLSLRQLAILMFVTKHGRASIGDLSDELHIPKPSVSRAVDKREGLKFCQREICGNDRRIIVAIPKVSGYKYVQRFEERLA